MGTLQVVVVARTAVVRVICAGCGDGNQFDALRSSAPVARTCFQCGHTTFVIVVVTEESNIAPMPHVPGGRR